MTNLAEIKILKAEFHDLVFKQGRCILSGHDCLRCGGEGWTVDPAFPCFVCRKNGQHVCEGPMDAHHVIRRMTVRNVVAEEDREAASWDARNGVPICRSGHGFVTTGTIKIPREFLPSQVWAFAGDYDILWVLEKMFNEGDWKDEA